MNPNLFQTLEQCLKNNNALTGPKSPVISKGSLCRFRYMFAKPGHDPMPMVLITDVNAQYIRGLNLNYLTFPVIKGLLQTYAENVGFSYSNVKGQTFIVSSFRRYKRGGISGILKLNSAFLLNTLACARSVDPNEIEAIRQVVREKMRQTVNQEAIAT